MTVGIDPNLIQFSRFFACQRVKFCNGFEFIAKKRQAPGSVFQMSRENFNRVTPDPEGASREAGIIAPILNFYQLLQ